MEAAVAADSVAADLAAEASAAVAAAALAEADADLAEDLTDRTATAAGFSAPDVITAEAAVSADCSDFF